ncbi:MAG: biotin--acetyl-CoA-carboxylase ligase [Desulfovibrio sp.]|nr:biotin--acetyl-CoA-carboxylase ligase [Desulfovibrio sp.]
MIRNLNAGYENMFVHLKQDLPAPCFLVEECESTFALAWELLGDGFFPDWASVTALCQSAGYGQLRRHWHSPRGNLHVTFRLPPNPLFAGNAAAPVLGLVVCKVLREFGFPILLKWPNDLLLGEEGKAGGILLEERDGVLLAGLGLNLLAAPDSGLLREEAALPAAALFAMQQIKRADKYEGAYLRQDLPRTPFPLWHLLLKAIISEYAGSMKGASLPVFIAGRAGLAAWVGRMARIDDDGLPENYGRIVGFGPAGGLVMDMNKGGRREIFNGSISLLPGSKMEKGSDGHQDF